MFRSVTPKLAMEFNSLLLLSPLLFCITSILLYIANRSINKQKRLPPGPKGLPIIGNLLKLGDRPHESLTMLAKIHGPLMTIKLGRVTTVVASSAEMAREILQKNDQAFLSRPIPDAATAETDYQHSVIWTPGGPKWQKLRKLLNNQVFTPQRLDALQELRHQMMENMLKRVFEAREAGEAIYIGRLVFGTSLSLLSNMSFSADVLDPNSKEVKELKDLIQMILELVGKPNLADFFPILKLFDPQGIRRDIKRGYDGLHSLIENNIDRRMKQRASSIERSGDFLDALLDHSEQYGPDELDRREVRLLLMDLFIGGTDTSSATVEWVMTELLHNPEKMAKVKQELVEKIGSGFSVKEADILQLPYLDAVLKETMRLHPAAPLITHSAMTDVQLCGFVIPKHTQVMVNAWSITRDAAYWKDPTIFLPERFLNSDLDFRGRDLSFIPFGAGRRICPGLPLAVRIVKLLLATLVHNFDWKLPNGMEPKDMDMRDKFGLTLEKAKPLAAIPMRVSNC
ncbi:geraniol 8-hydroxylase-like [Coffea arabica]|uniref:Geraniol 8-hydroxylase-like n=1 Tax=Coffea arabica TaxID=13443 RepID=A0A6P6TRB9_COFAR|nr:geraniol 8-hydroxylase-like [Coffea arabica]